MVEEAKSSLTKAGDERNLFGSPVHMACLCDNSEALYYLLFECQQEGYDPLEIAVKKKNYGGMTAMHLCARQGSMNCYEVLLNFILSKLDK